MDLCRRSPKYKLSDCTKRTLSFVDGVHENYGNIYRSKDIYRYYVKQRTISKGRDIYLKERLKRILEKIDEEEFDRKVEILLGSATINSPDFPKLFTRIVKEYSKDKDYNDIVRHLKTVCLYCLASRDCTTSKRFTNKYRKFIRRYMKVRGRSASLMRFQKDLSRFSQLDNRELKNLMRIWKEQLDESNKCVRENSIR